MPEIKNSFLQGKMNKDLDERLLPNGQYRDALNIEVSTSESSNVGVAQNILGNYRLENLVDTDIFKCVGSIANEKTDRLYWFISSYEKDVILEHDIFNNVTRPILVDINAGNYKAVLKFSGNIITGINIIDNLLFWTDNNSEPKKINIDECRRGTDPDMEHHTQLLFEKGSFRGLTLENVGNNGDGSGLVSNKFWFRKNRIAPIFPKDYAEAGGGQPGLPVDWANFPFIFKVRHYRNKKFLGIKQIAVYDSAGDGNYARLHPSSTMSANNDDWEKGDILFGDDISMNIEERHITVIKPKPLTALSVKINHQESVGSISKIPNLFETKFPRFSYRYKYKDGEYSAFAPFTGPVFNPKYPKDTGVSIDTNIFYNKDTAYDIKEPYNKAMVNSIHSVELSDFITTKTPEDVVEIDVLYKQEESSVIYSIDTIKHGDLNFHALGNNEGNINYGVGKSGGGSFQAWGGLTQGKHVVTTENIYAALPANQLLRPWDNVPKKAQAQEVTGNRIVYGNYVQNYDLVQNTNISVAYNDRKNNIGSFVEQGLPSVKSQRNYQLGVIYCDKYGRETPVLTSSRAAINVPWQDTSGKKNASRSIQLSSSVATNFPEWVDSIKFFVKENSNEYYNMTMDRAWVTKSTYELDDSEGHLWISFPSSDRNKIQEKDYIILKKKIGAGEEQVNFENKFKVIDIKNEAPDALRYQLVNLGVARNNNANIFTGAQGIFTFNNGYDGARIDKSGGNEVAIQISKWTSFGSFRSELIPGNDDDNPTPKDLYISWRRDGTDDLSASKKYKVSGGRRDSGYYNLLLSTPITQIDADIAHVSGDSSITGQTDFNADLIFQVEKRELKEQEDFSGKFFVKISKNQVTDIIESGNPIDVLEQFQVTSKTPSWYWQDNIPNQASQNAKTNSTEYGILNYFGEKAGAGSYLNTPSSGNNIKHPSNNVEGAVVPNNSSGGGGAMRVTDYPDPWKGIKSIFDSTFFIDSMHMAAGQSEVSDYAKFSCITWSGLDEDNDTTDRLGSCWSYPPLKTWITDLSDTANLITPAVEYTGLPFMGENAMTIPPQSVWYENNLISTSSVLEPNDDYQGLQVDGWVGPLQSVDRYVPTNSNFNHVNGLEGIVTTVAAHASGVRRWFSGITGGASEYGVGSNTKTYSVNGEINKHFMHLSFFAPGKDLHDNTWHFNSPSDQILYGENTWMDNLQGIWGGGVFTGRGEEQTFGVVGGAHVHLAMEGNYDDSLNILPETPGPGVGYGYDLDYRELHERQWDPTFCDVGDDDNKIRDFIRNLHAGSQFKFATDDQSPQNVYTIKNVTIKKLYNHTSWRETYNRRIDGATLFGGYDPDQEPAVQYHSVEKTALAHLSAVHPDGHNTANIDDTPGDYTTDNNHKFKKRIVDFGAAHNRRLCFIIELDKNPVDSSFNPLDVSRMTADFTNSDFLNIEFLDSVKSVLLSDLSKFPAIWEVDPQKSVVDLDIYYEASGSIPTKINNETNEIFAPLGCDVEVLGSGSSGIAKLTFWDNNVATLYPGLPKGDGSGNEIDYNGMSFKFIREDGGYNIAEAGEQSLDGNTTGLKTTFTFKEDVGKTIATGLSWYNCFSFSNGIESNRIKDDFNEIFITNGVKASTTSQKAYKEERRKHGLIYSGIYNSNSGVNDLNQFIAAEKITKDLNPTYGSIQKLFQRRISLIAFCEDRVIGINAGKDTLFNADGNSQLVATNNVLGDATPFEGNYGISRNPESFASESYRAYFTDKQRGSVLRLSKDGLTPISKAGMQDWFRDNLSEFNSLIGTYDAHKEDYNITLTNDPSFAENLLLDSSIETGEELNDNDIVGSSNLIQNPGVYNSANGALQYYWETYNVLSLTQANNVFKWDPFTADAYAFKGSADIIHHQAIPMGSLNDGGVDYDQGSTAIPAVPYEWEKFAFGGSPSSFVAYDWTTSVALPTSNGSIPGQVYFGNFDIVSGDIFSDDVNYSNPNTDSNISSGIYRYNVSPGNEGQPNGSPGNAYYGFDPRIEMDILFPAPVSNNSNSENTRHGSVRHAFTRNAATKNITSCRNRPGSYIEFSDFGINDTGDLNNAYDAATVASNSTNTTTSNHNAFFPGDEIHIEVQLLCYKTANATTVDYIHHKYGRNYIIPKIELRDGSGSIDATVFVGAATTTSDPAGGYWGPYYHAYSTSDDAFGPATYSTTGYQEHLIDDKGYQGSGSVEFTATDNSVYENKLYRTDNNFASGIAENYNWWATKMPLTLRCSWKIDLDVDQAQNASYPLQTGVDPAAVINDLRVRISNEQPAYQGNYGGNKWSIFRYALWEIETIKIVKGYGKVAPKQLFEQETGVNIDETIAVAPCPTENIPAWTEVIHDSNYGFGNNSWVLTPSVYGGLTGNKLYSSNLTNAHGFGGNNSAQEIDTGNEVNSVDTDQQGAVIKFMVPQGHALAPTSPAAPTGDFASPFGNNTNPINPFTGLPLETFNRVGESNNTYNKTSYSHNNDYIHIQNVGGDVEDAAQIKYDITSEPWNNNDWYLLDIEFDETYGAGIAGQFNDPTGGDGIIFVQGVIATGYNSDMNVGEYWSHQYDAGCVRLVPHFRTEYGIHKTVLRAIFKLETSSWIYANDPDTFKIRVRSCENGVKITKIITKILGTSAPYHTGADNWTMISGNGNSDIPIHAFDKRHVYFKAGKLCWEVVDDDGYGAGSQPIANKENYAFKQDVTPTISQAQWELKFTVTKNPSTDAFSGNLTGYINGGAGFDGPYFKDITEAGSYRIKFNFNTTATDWVFERADLGNTNYSVYSGGTIEEISNSAYASAATDNRIVFRPLPGQTAVNQEYAISGIALTDFTPIFSGGAAGSWNFEGYNASINDYISWNPNDTGQLVFQDCPVSDVTTDQLTFININQQIDKTINQFEQYKISFTHNINANIGNNSAASLAIYYYNSNGFGFKIIDANNSSNFNTLQTPNNGDPYYQFEQVITIGELNENGSYKDGSLWSGVNDDNNAYDANLKNSFVIEVQGSVLGNDRINGYIDNIEMLQVFAGTNPTGTTVSFSENVNGWTSFKDFVPENGVSLSKKYFTFENGGLYQHYVPLVDVNGSWTTGIQDATTNNFVKHRAEEAQNYNRFYGVDYHSSIQAVLNQEPSMVKMFNTINYEGSQAYVVKPAIAANITINNATAFSANADILGWQCIDITTDLDAGSVIEFIKKEGKWFNYIKGLNKTPAMVDTSLFSVQGIGVINGDPIDTSGYNDIIIGGNSGSTPSIINDQGISTPIVIGGSAGGGGGGNGGGNGGGGGGGY